MFRSRLAVLPENGVGAYPGAGPRLAFERPQPANRNYATSRGPNLNPDG